MTNGSLLAVASVLLIAVAPNFYVFAAGWLMAGAAMAATFYQPAFAALTRWWGPVRPRAPRQPVRRPSPGFPAR